MPYSNQKLHLTENIHDFPNSIWKKDYSFVWFKNLIGCKTPKFSQVLTLVQLLIITYKFCLYRKIEVENDHKWIIVFLLSLMYFKIKHQTELKELCELSLTIHYLNYKERDDHGGLITWHK